MFKDNDKKYTVWGVTAFCVVAASMLFFFFIFRMNEVAELFGKIMKILAPIIYGLVIAYLLSPIANYWNRVLAEVLGSRMKNEKHALSLAKGLSVVITLVIAFVVVCGLLILVLPRLVESIAVIIDSFPFYIKEVQDFVDNLLEENPELLVLSEEAYERGMDHLESFLSTELLPQMNTLLTGLTNGIIGVFNSFLNMMIGVIVSIYVLMSKEKFTGQAKKMLYALLKPNLANNVLTVMRQSNRIFGGFISGKLLDSLIIGIICFIGLYIMKTPYTVLVSVIVGVTNVIPFFGPYIGAIPSAFLILLVDWHQCIFFVIFIIILQQIDGNILGPKILGNSTGLSAFWVVFAILLGGGLFGFAGMLLGVPVFAVIYYVIKTFIEWRLAKKKLPTDSDSYCAVEYIGQGNAMIYWKEPDNKDSLIGRMRKKEKEQENTGDKKENKK